MHIQSSSFRFRRFNTLVTFIAFLAALLSGIALYLRPEGSLARWINWSFVGLDKKQWEAAHTIVTLLFFISGLIHLAHNLRPLITYLRGRVSLVFASGARIPLFRELGAALALVVVVMAGAVAQWPGFDSVSGLRAEFKEGKYSVRMLPPVLDADKLTVPDFCHAAAIDTNQALLNARRHGLVVENLSLDIGKIALKNGITPEQVFIALRGD